MPVLHNQKKGDKLMTVVEFGTGDVMINNTIDPINGLILSNDKPKPVEEWRIGAPFSYDTETKVFIDEFKGDQVYLEFNKVESVTSLIEVLQEIKRRMIEANNPRNYHDFTENPN